MLISRLRMMSVFLALRFERHCIPIASLEIRMPGLIDENDPHGLGAGKASRDITAPDDGLSSRKKRSRAWWLIPLILIGSMLLCCGVCGGLAFKGMGVFKNNPVVLEAVRRAEADPILQQEIGVPMEIKVMDLKRSSSLDMNQNGSRTEFSGRMGIYGPNGGGLIEIEGEENSGKHTFQLLSVTPDSTGTPIDLSGNPPTTSNAAGDPDEEDADDSVVNESENAVSSDTAP